MNLTTHEKDLATIKALEKEVARLKADLDLAHPYGTHYKSEIITLRAEIDALREKLKQPIECPFCSSMIERHEK